MRLTGWSPSAGSSTLPLRRRLWEISGRGCRVDHLRRIPPPPRRLVLDLRAMTSGPWGAVGDGHDGFEGSAVGTT